MNRTLILPAAVAVLAACAVARAEVFVLHNGSRIVGELVNADELFRKTYVIRTPQGATVTLDKSQVTETRYQRPEKVQYAKIRPTFADTVEDQWALAEWCRERHMHSEREQHLERILELDPNHEGARRALGYTRTGDDWQTQEQFMKENGYVWYERRWRLPQEVQLLEERKGRDDAEDAWRKKITMWHRWLSGDKARVAQENFRAIRDPAAVKPIADVLRDKDNSEQVRILCVETLAKIGSPAAMKILAVWTLADPVEEVGLTCLDYLRDAGDHEAVVFFIGKLASKDNTEINRAATALRHMGDTSAIEPLIDALVTTHKYKVTSGNPGQMSTTFGSGGAPGGLSVGGSTKIITRQIANRAVLDALVELTGGQNYGFDQDRWRAWIASRQRGSYFNPRRD